MKITEYSIPVPNAVVKIPDTYTFSFHDSPAAKTVVVNINCGPGLPPVQINPLWAGAQYAAAGNYTQDDLNNAVAAWIASLPKTSPVAG